MKNIKKKVCPKLRTARWKYRKDISKDVYWDTRVDQVIPITIMNTRVRLQVEFYLMDLTDVEVKMK